MPSGFFELVVFENESYVIALHAKADLSYDKSVALVHLVKKLCFLYLLYKIIIKE